jgi:hypothetical protein
MGDFIQARRELRRTKKTERNDAAERASRAARGMKLPQRRREFYLHWAAPLGVVLVAAVWLTRIYARAAAHAYPVPASLSGLPDLSITGLWLDLILLSIVYLRIARVVTGYFPHLSSERFWRAHSADMEPDAVRGIIRRAQQGGIGIPVATAVVVILVSLATAALGPGWSLAFAILMTIGFIVVWAFGLAFFGRARFGATTRAVRSAHDLSRLDDRGEQ